MKSTENDSHFFARRQVPVLRMTDQPRPLFDDETPDALNPDPSSNNRQPRTVMPHNSPGLPFQGTTVMSNPFNPSSRFAIVPVMCDSFGREVIPTNAIAHGPMSVIMERVLDSRTRNDCIELTRKAAKALGTLESVGSLKQRAQALKSREDAVSAREDTVTRTLLRDALGKIDALSRRLDALEEQSELEELVFPPGYEPEQTTDQEDPADLPPASAPPPPGDLHALPPKTNGYEMAAKLNGHATNGHGDNDSDDDDQPEVPPQYPLPPPEQTENT